MEPEVPGFVHALQKLKHVKAGEPLDPGRKSPHRDIIGQNFGSIWSKDELEDEEDERIKSFFACLRTS